jgi:uncharacterized protein
MISSDPTHTLPDEAHSTAPTPTPPVETPAPASDPAPETPPDGPTAAAPAHESPAHETPAVESRTDEPHTGGAPEAPAAEAAHAEPERTAEAPPQPAAREPREPALPPQPIPEVPPAPQPHDLSRVAQDLQIRKAQVEAVVQLLDDENTVPFITRYRKEVTGGLNEEVIRRIQDRVAHLRGLADRKRTILKSIAFQGKLTDALTQAILAAESPKRLEDLYLPYKPKKKSLATEARERGLGPLAEAIFNRDPAVADLAAVLPGLVDPDKWLLNTDDVMAGVRNILADLIADSAEVRGPLRAFTWDTGRVVSNRIETVPEGKGKEYEPYFDFREPVKEIPPHRVLAINRGEKGNVLRVRVDTDAALAKEIATYHLNLTDHPHKELMTEVLADALDRLLRPSLEREIRRDLTDRAQEHAIAIFAKNLKSLLLQPPLRGRKVLAVDPGIRTGCKLAALDETGKLLEDAVVYPQGQKRNAADAKRKMEQLVRRYQISVVAIGNGTGCREAEQLVADLIADLAHRRLNPVPDVPPPAAPPPEPPAAPLDSPAAVPVPASVTLDGGAPPATVEAVTLSTDLPAAVSLAPADESTPAAPPPAGETLTTGTPETVVVPVQAPPPAAPQPAAAPPISLEGLPPAPEDLAYVIVIEAGASDYSASPVAREEFPDLDATTRGTISIGRRLQDPLAELVKIDPQHIGVGLYQHDVKPKHLKESLEGVIESSVNQVGVEVNTASVPLLRHVSGLNQLVARELVNFREKNGPFASREQLLQVPGLGEKRFTQAAGFLKLREGADPLDATWIHPESYALARQILTDFELTPADLRDRMKVEELRAKLNAADLGAFAAKFGVSEATIDDIFAALARPGRDPREDLPPPIFKTGVLKLEDITPGMELKGTVLNVVPFGAFVDIGLKESGLVHISQMANRYIKSPYDVVAVGDVVTVWVVEVKPGEKKISLAMIPPGQERQAGGPRGRFGGPPQGEPRGEREQRGDRGGERDQRGPRPTQQPPVQQAPVEPQQQQPRERPPFQPRAGQGQGFQPRGGQGFQPRGQGQGQGRGYGPRPGPGGPRPGQGQGGQGPAPGAPPADGSAPPAGGGATQPPAPPPPPPRKPGKPKPIPQVTPEQVKGKKPVFDFGALAAVFQKRQEQDAPPAPPAPAEPQAEAAPAEPKAEPKPDEPKPDGTTS